MSTRSDSTEGLTRRELLGCGIGATAGLLIPGQANANQSQRAATSAGKAKSVIQIWMWGGPPHLDTFDPKPQAGSDYCGPFSSPIKTNVDGLQICELMPELAKMADKYSVIRSMTHGNNSHETAAYIVQTGRLNNNGLVYPGMGAVVTLMKGGSSYKGLLPPYIVLTELQGRFSETGFLGNRVKPFATGGDPAQARFAVEGIVAEGVTEQHQKGRRDLLHNLNTLDRALRKDDARVAAMGQCEAEAYDTILGDAGKVFDLSAEKDTLRAKYGKNTFGQSCLMARRLVERGVPYITINYKGWDLHKQIFPALRRKLPELDNGISALLQDLSDHGLLDSTIILCCGEFGRTPKVMWEEPWNGGRGHHGEAFSALIAGGGFKGGHVIGSTDAHGETVTSRPVYPWDVMRSMYEQLGIDPDGTLPHPALTVRVAPSAADGVALGGKLIEIM